ncbi:WXG100 family type VII secretion target [Kitasatospora sp. NPDC017646]|uniref:WXG100-like domain-containing protein n=1 Tax=Kitasatospora sp. NPDC017646 TaxID=3364024 RepID=UPI0037BBB81A
MVYTDFTKYSHADLRKMAQALDPGAVMAAGDPWRKAATTLKEIRKTLTKVSTEAATSWEGTTSDTFHTSMLTLASNINEVAAYANDAANTLHNMSEAMATAKRDMPEEPGNWDKFKDTVGDLFSTEDDHIQIADQKKAEAAAVMQTLAMHYRIATPALKAPSLMRTGGREESHDVGTQDPSNAAAAMTAAVMMASPSVGVGGTAARATTTRVSPRPNSQSSMLASSGSKNVAVPTDSGIKGGTAQAPPKPLIAASRDSDGSISGTPVSRPSGSANGTQTSGLSGVPSTVPSSGPIVAGGGQTTDNPTAPTVQSAPVGAGFGQSKAGSTPPDGPGSRGGRNTGVGGGEGYQGIGAGGRGAARTKEVGGSLAKPGGAVRETPPPSAGARGKQAFTEGGSGLGVRSRLNAEPGARSTGAMAPGIPTSEAQRRKRDRGKDGKRPDYLVEDEETWASDKPANPNVVE